MEKHLTLTDSEFESQFASLQLDPALFTHEAHIRLAWVHIRKYGAEVAISNICSQISVFATHHGATGKYHRTLTEAAVRAVYHFYLKGPGIEDFSTFIEIFPRLKTQFKNLLDSHYSPGLLKSQKAKQTYLQPDLLPFD